MLGVIDPTLTHQEIIGVSPALKAVLEQAKKAAMSDAPVLLLGEPGSGKESVARAIHRISPRRHESFIKFNGSLIPAERTQSSLFRHDQGILTCTPGPQAGRLEEASEGTLFLDEVADFPLGLQPKLLHELRKRKLKSVNNNHPIDVTVRVIAASTYPLGRWVTERRFHSDLYNFVKKVSIQVPSLRQRREDIPLLARYFVQMFAQRMKKRIETIPAQTMDTLMSCSWPGNVRELENFIERAVIFTAGPKLQVPPSDLVPDLKASSE